MTGCFNLGTHDPEPAAAARGAPRADLGSTAAGPAGPTGERLNDGGDCCPDGKRPDTLSAD